MLVRSSFLLSLFALFISGGFVVYQTLEKPKLAYVDSAQLIRQYQGMQDAVKVYQSKAAVWQANIDTLSAELSRTIQAFEEKKVALSQNEKSLTEEFIQTKRQQLINIILP